MTDPVPPNIFVTTLPNVPPLHCKTLRVTDLLGQPTFLVSVDDPKHELEYALTLLRQHPRNPLLHCCASNKSVAYELRDAAVLAVDHGVTPAVLKLMLSAAREDVLKLPVRRAPGLKHDLEARLQRETVDEYRIAAPTLQRPGAAVGGHSIGCL